MKLYYAETVNPRKACAAARYLGAPVQFVRVDLATGEHRKPPFLALNPNGKVPVLQHGESRIWEANAIMGYLAQSVRSDMWPSGAGQIEVLRWLSWDAQHFSRHANTLYFEYVIKPIINIGPANESAVQEATAQVRQYARILDDHLRDRTYLLGNTLTIADFAVAAALPYAEQAHIPLTDFPQVERWHDRLNELDAWREPFPKAAA